MSSSVKIPNGFKQLLQEFTVAVLRENPDDAIDFAVKYFTDLQDLKLAAKNNSSILLQGQFSNDVDSDDIDDNEPSTPPQSRGLRRVAVAGESFDPEKSDDEDMIPIPKYPKSDDQRLRLEAAVQHILLFRCLDEDQLETVIEAMFERPVHSDETIITQGDDGDNFYVVESGFFEAFIKKNGTNVKVGEYDNQGSFGELALMYNAPRSATIVATQSGNLWAMSRDTFRRLVLKKAFKKRVAYENLLDSVPMLKEMSSYERMNVADALRSRSYESERTILHEGNEGEEMYFIEEGEILISRNGVELNRLKKGDYFGELALLTKQPRFASAKAITKSKLAVLDVSAFERLLGPCFYIMNRNIEDYEIQLVKIFGSTESIPQLRIR